MDQKESQTGFVEVLLIVAGMVGFALVTMLHSPHFEAPIFSSNTDIITPTDSPSPTPTPIQAQADEAVGVVLNDDFTLTIRHGDEKETIALLGIEPIKIPSACSLNDQKKELIKKIVEKPVYLVDSDIPIKGQTVPAKYVFLSDLTFLNTALIAQGLAQPQAGKHLYQKEFVREATYSKDNTLGVWSDACNPTPLPTRTPTPLPTATRIPTPTRKPTVTKVPTETTQPILTKKSQPLVQGESTSVPLATTSANLLSDYITPVLSPNPSVQSLNSDLILQLINLHRQQMDLPPLQKDPPLCALAQSRTPELYDEIFVTGKIHEGLYKRSIPYWITENMASYPSEQIIVHWWLNSSIHRAAIEGDYRYSCGACSGTSCAQLFTSYVPKAGN